jgi:alcohol-forming fatty acyl-CoA reductase
MAEHMLVLRNAKKIPLVFVRPSIVGTAADEPMPGWTDTVNMIQGVTLTVGLGILRDLPGKVDHIADIVPVDFVVRQILVSIPFIIA